MNAIAKPVSLVPEMTAELLNRVIGEPLLLLPPQWAAVVFQFWMKVSDIVKTQLSLASQLREWITEEGLTLDEAQAAFRKIGRPESRAKLRFPGDVIVELAAEVAELCRRRRQVEQQRADRERAEKDRREAAPPNVLRDMLAGIGLGGK